MPISVYRELDAAFDYVTGLIADEKIACHYTPLRPLHGGQFASAL